MEKIQQIEALLLEGTNNNTNDRHLSCDQGLYYWL